MKVWVGRGREFLIPSLRSPVFEGFRLRNEKSVEHAVATLDREFVWPSRVRFLDFGLVFPWLRPLIGIAVLCLARESEGSSGVIRGGPERSKTA